MASSQGKKGKKTKGVTVDLSTFLSNGAPRPSDDTVTVTTMATTSWADEMDNDDPPSFGKSKTAEQICLPSAPRSARGPDYDEEKIPYDPPYTAHVANLPFDVSEEDIMKFFSHLKIKNVRLPREDESGRLKGFGYADFEDRASLVEALAMDCHKLNNRALRIDLATYSGKGDRGNRYGGGGNRYGEGNRYGDSEDDPTQSNWRSAGPPPPTSSGRDYDRGYDRDRGGDSERRDGYRGRDDRNSDRGGGGGGGGFDTFDRSQMRPVEEARSESRRYGGDRPDRYERGGSGSRYDRYERKDDRYERRDGGGSRDSVNSRYPQKERPKLVLAKRTVDEATESDSAPAPPPSIFGGAKPVDTAKREMEMLERLKKKEEEETKKVDEVVKKVEAQKVSIFGGAKPVDTSVREREIEERLRKMDLERRADPEKGQLDEGEGEKRKRIHADRDRHYRPTSRGSGSGRRHNEDWRRGGDRDRSERDRDHDRGRDRDRERGRERDTPRSYKKDKSPPPLKKMEETKPPNFVGSNKFLYLQQDEENEVESGKDSE